MTKSRSLWIFACVWMVALHVYAAGPRWVAGSQWQNSGQIMNWYRTDVQYFVDEGALSSSVSHAAAVSMIDAAAAVWNVPSVSFTLTDGGALAEDVSSSTVYLGSNGPVWPADVQSSNYTAKQIAIVLDADGSLTDMLLGSGASDPSNCRQNAVTESVDLFIQPGKVAHAVLLLNGLCTGPAPEQQLQMQYQLMRAFGRVIGIGWSQTNDNVFTYSPVPTAEQMAHWPIMHPIDILCGLYTYQCLPSAFTLRPDDVAALNLVYDTGTPPVNMPVVVGTLTFPGGEGMNGLNLVAKRSVAWAHYAEQFEEVSGITGYLSSGDSGNAVTGASTDTLSVQGSTDSRYRGFYKLFVPGLIPFGGTDLTVTTEAVNPLYTGAYAVGPYRSATVQPSGGDFTQLMLGIPLTNLWVLPNRAIPDAATSCNTSSDGTEAGPSALPEGGTWSGLLCNVGHSAWNTFAVKAGRTATLEVTATDEHLVATSAKARPVIGLWHGADATGVMPTLAATPGALNTSHTGMTQMNVSFGAAETVRMAIADQRGDGRPDYTYSVRLLYADTVTPSRMPAAGGAVRIVGTGFQQGNTVMVGGVLAQVTSVTATEIDAIAPAAVALGGAAVNDVIVTDLSTGGTASITGGLTYSGASTDVLSMVVAPGASIATGLPMPFALKVVDAAGTAVANAAVSVTVSGAGAVIGACQLATCTLVTDATGVVSTQGTAAAAGTVALQASVRSGSAVSASWTVLAVNAVGFVRPTQYVAAGTGAVFHPSLMATANGAGAAGLALAWSTTSAHIALASSAGGTGSDGSASVGATGTLMAGEAAAVQACAWTSVCATESVVGVAAADMGVVMTAGDGQSVAASATLGSVGVRVVDAAGHPVAGATVMIYQLVTGWQPPCVVGGRCAPAPVYGSSSTPAMSDDDGNVQVTPLQYANAAGVTKITVTAGTQGVVTVAVQKTP